MKLFFPFSFFILMACHISPSAEDLVQHMVVQTTYNENTAFSFYSTFTLSPDTLGLLSNVDPDTLFSNEYARKATAAIKKNMINAGYTFLTRKQNPDLGFAAYVVENYNVFQQVNYLPYYSGYYGYGYGGYYGTPYVSTYDYSTTFMVINLIDLKNRDAENRLKVIWTAYIGDLEHSVDQQGKVLEAIDQAFRQSAGYLHRP